MPGLRLGDNLESAQIAARFGCFHPFGPDKGADAGVTNGLSEGCQFLLSPFGGQFDASVGKVPHGTANVKALRHLAGCVPEAHSLHGA